MRELLIPRIDKPKVRVLKVPDARYVHDSVIVEIAQIIPADIVELPFLRLIEYEGRLGPSRGMYIKNFDPTDQPPPRRYRSAWLDATGQDGAR